ncbi:hypothetical protein C1I91_13900 [Clostridium manihotivorum]|uniref:HTH marR-type domain-containing protein n=2 Tax=Clostridium manihotivorum TaxID=2320868 RepID=A0A3R5QU28_9CLOT|nr:hypothetical protein C1I91_13900 [Clostridium manihotivorum]
MYSSEQLGDLLIAINKELKTKIERELKFYGIGMGQLHILMLFYAHSGETFSQNDIVKLLNIDKGNISRSIMKLQDKEYLEQVPTNSKTYRLSEQGIVLKTEIMSKFNTLHQAMILDIGQNELKQTVLTLSQILKNLEVF